MVKLAGVVPMTSSPTVERNLARATALVKEAVSRGAELVVLPENFAFLSDHSDAAAERLKVAESISVGGTGEGPIVQTLSALAKEMGVPLVLGGMAERLDEPDAKRAHNSCVYVDERGVVGAVYRKIHLFDVDVPDGVRYRESDGVAPGEQVVAVDTPLGKLGLSVCYDVRFPELYRRLAADGARLLTVPAAFTLHTGRDHWHLLLRARAVENLCFVLAAAQYGRHGDKRVTYGHALICDPWGQVLAEVGDQEGVAVAPLDFDYQDKLRRELPALAHRRL